MSLLASLIALPAVAQTRARPALPPVTAVSSTVGASERAEHEQWEVDTAKWMAEHEAAATQLSAIATRLRSSDHELARYDASIKAHEARLGARSEEGPQVLAAHMRMRSAHETMRMRHAALLSAVQQLQRAVDNDDDNGRPSR